MGLAHIDRWCKVVATYNNAGEMPVSPTYGNVATAAWPLTRVMYFNTNKNPAKPQDPVLRELPKFVLSKEGQQIVLDRAVFLPFRASQQSKSLKILG